MSSTLQEVSSSIAQPLGIAVSVTWIKQMLVPWQPIKAGFSVEACGSLLWWWNIILCMSLWALLQTCL